MLYLAIPAHNEVATIGVLLWRLRTVLAEFPREYEVVVYDDASTDDTAAVAEQYERAMPVSVLRGRARLGYAGAVDALLRHVATLTRYPRRDAVLLLQGDFTDPPVIVPEFARRFEGGADLVVGERLTVADAPTAVKRLFKYGHWAMRPFVKVSGVADLTASMRLVRISALREAIRLAGTAPLVSGDSWTANADLLLRLAPHARRVESVPMEPTFGVRMRETRRVAMADTLSTLKWAWASRGRRAVVGSSPAETGPEEKRGPRGGGKRRDEPELSVERIREKVRERDGSSGIDGEAPEPRRGRRDRGERTERGDRQARAERPARGERTREAAPARDARAGNRDGTREGVREGTREGVRDGREPREPREPRERTRAPRGGDTRSGAPQEPARPIRTRDESRPPSVDPTVVLDDPFAAPARREPALPLPDDTREVATPPVMAAAPTDELLPPPVHATGTPLTETPLSATEETGRGDADDEAESDVEGAGDGDVGADGEPRRKRRRNRRSRRGRRRKGDEGGGDGGAEGGDADDGGHGEPTGEGREAGEARAPGGEERVRFLPGDHVDGEPVAPRPRRPHRSAAQAGESELDPVEAFADGGDNDDGDDGDDEIAGVESMSEGAPRPRRRGRRGRRGGARRSRGRKDGGDEHGGASRGDERPEGRGGGEE